MKYLPLHIDCMMQHYPSVSSTMTSLSGIYNRTERVPTRNAIVGMIGAVLGYQRESEEIAKLKNAVKLKYDVLNLGTVFTDFQTVKPRKGDGFKKVDGGTSDSGIIKKVEYLQGANFTVYVGGEECFLKKIHEAFLNPVYLPYVGKKCCMVSGTIIDDDFILIEEELVFYANDCP